MFLTQRYKANIIFVKIGPVKVILKSTNKLVIHISLLLDQSGLEYKSSSLNAVDHL